MGGLSPPTRGSQHLASGLASRLGSIPAHAGKPTGEAAMGDVPGVYPRPRGEALRGAFLHRLWQGLSPPTRGSRHRCGAGRRSRRSIPAHAGKPVPVEDDGYDIGVYPRPRGEASWSGERVPLDNGLSPPTRGSLAPHDEWLRVHGSIPAHAGKPEPHFAKGKCRRVYPRPRGEANLERRASHLLTGLSPPTRGSQPNEPVVADVEGSIPAHAGKPVSGAVATLHDPVYPRPRGEAWSSASPTGSFCGLSPPTRGSPI